MILDADVIKLECIYEGLIKSIVDVDNYGLKCNTLQLETDLKTASLYLDAISFSPTICKSFECKILDFIQSKQTYTLNYPNTCVSYSSSSTPVVATITCPATINADTLGNPTVVVNYPIPTYTTNCPSGGTLVFVSGPNPGPMAIGNYTVTYGLIDSCGTSINCSFVINVTTSI